MLLPAGEKCSYDVCCMTFGKNCCVKACPSTRIEEHRNAEYICPIGGNTRQIGRLSKINFSIQLGISQCFAISEYNFLLEMFSFIKTKYAAYCRRFYATSNYIVPLHDNFFLFIETVHMHTPSLPESNQAVSYLSSCECVAETDMLSCRALFTVRHVQRDKN